MHLTQFLLLYLSILEYNGQGTVTTLVYMFMTKLQMRRIISERVG